MNLRFTPVEFENETVVITDPCYFLFKPNSENEDKGAWNSWEYYGNEFELEKIGVERYATESTIYGDWSCTVYEMFTNRKLGEFCADSGIVTVIPLEEILKFNPTWTKWVEEHSHAATLIPNFTGKVAIIHADKGYGKECWVEGRGNIDFYSKQTGL